MSEAEEVKSLPETEQQVDAILELQGQYQYLAKKMEDELAPLRKILPYGKKGKHVHDLPANTYEALMEHAASVKSKFEALCLLALKGDPESSDEQWKRPINDITVSFLCAALKGKARIEEKVKLKYCGDFSRVIDIVRSSFVLNDIRQMEQLLILIHRMQTLSEGEVVRLKNGFKENQTPGGYRDLKLSLKIDGHVCEVQIHVREFVDLKEESHVLYEWARKFDPIYGLTEEILRDLDPIQQRPGRGSLLFRAIEMRNVELTKCFLLHPNAKKVINGTSDSWPPFALSMTMGHCEIARVLMSHSDFDFSTVPWQFETYVIREAVRYDGHPDLDQDMQYEKILAVVKEFFDRRVAANLGTLTFEEYKEFVCSERVLSLKERDEFMSKHGIYLIE